MLFRSLVAMRAVAIAISFAVFCVFATTVNSLACWSGATLKGDKNALNYTTCPSGYDKCAAASAECTIAGAGTVAARGFGCTSQAEWDASLAAQETLGCTISDKVVCSSDLCNSGMTVAVAAAPLVAALVALLF